MIMRAISNYDVARSCHSVYALHTHMRVDYRMKCNAKEGGEKASSFKPKISDIRHQTRPKERAIDHRGI
jgi:hypothetical protein